MDQVSENQVSRQQWADIAKGISILLVVAWHSTITSSDPVLSGFNQVNESLIFLRMPLFFFVSGFFVRKALAMKWQNFLKLRIAHLLWIFVVWAVIADLAFHTGIALLKSGTVSFRNPLTYFTSPPLTLWFVYALAIGFTILKFLKNVTPWIVLPLLFLAYAFHRLMEFGAMWRFMNGCFVCYPFSTWAICYSRSSASF